MFPRRLLSAIVALGGVALLPLGSGAMPLYATRQGLQCATCHFDPQGGGARNEFGFLYEKNRHDLAPDVGKWADLVLSNKLGDALYFGTSLRQQYTLVHDVGSPSGSDVSTFFPMQGALNVVFAPHPNLTILYDRDLHDTRDAWGMIHGLPGGLYIKAGQFRVLFGLRVDDHTGALRAGFRDAAVGSFGTSGFLPFDPRQVEGGLELGFTPATGFLMTGAITNGGPVFANQAQAFTGKLSYVGGRFIAGLSGYHNYVSTSRREDRRGSLYAGLNVVPALQLLAEGGLGRTDDGAGTLSDQRAFWGEANYRVSRAWLVRAKYDFVDLDHRVAGLAQERYTVETDYTPVPFANLKLSFRRIVPEDAPDQNQYLAQWLFYY